MVTINYKLYIKYPHKKIQDLTPNNKHIIHAESLNIHSFTNLASNETFISMNKFTLTVY